jgi:L-lactate dehydrogenase complex protein LldF
MVTSLPRVHVAVVGIEKMVATLEDYALLTQVLPRSSTGQLMTVYTHLINGPRRSDESDGAEHVYIILLDNGRSKMYGTTYAEALACLRCGACLNGCPVYKVSGGHAYGWVYSGPIGAILTPLFKGLDQARPLPHASSLCGTCKEVCPVDIDMPRMLLDLRHDQVVQKLDEKKWKWSIKAWARVNCSPRLFGLAGTAARLATAILPTRNLPGPLSGWTRYRTFPNFAKKSFRQQWKERIPRS